MNTKVLIMYLHHKRGQQQYNVRNMLQGVSGSSNMTPPPPDPARRIQQDWDTQIDHDEGGLQEEKAEDPFSGGHIDGKHQDAGLEASDEKGANDDEEEQKGRKLTAAWGRRGGKGGRTRNHSVGAIIKRRESQPERTLTPKASAGDAHCKKAERSRGPEGGKKGVHESLQLVEELGQQ